MFKPRLLYVGLLATLIAAPAFAQTATPPANPVGGTVATDTAQQQQIEQGLQSGQLSTGEAAKLEKGEQRIDNAQSQALKHGDTPADAARIQQMQTKEENHIQKLDSNGVAGNPNSASSQRMQGDVQRNVNQDQRIQNGVANGSLTNGEAARMEKGQAHVDRKEAHAGKNGNVSAAEQRRIQRAENRQNKHIYKAKHNRHVNPEAPASSGAAAPGAGPTTP